MEGKFHIMYFIGFCKCAILCDFLQVCILKQVNGFTVFDDFYKYVIIEWVGGHVGMGGGVQSRNIQ